MGSSSAASHISPRGESDPLPGRASSETGEIRKLSTLLEASQALSGSLNLRASLHRVLETLGRHHGAIRSTIALLQDDEKEVVVEVSDGPVRTGSKAARY